MAIIYSVYPLNSKLLLFHFFIYYHLSTTHQLNKKSYPNNNCAAEFAADGPIIIPQTVFSSYMTHSAAVNLVQPYLNSTSIAQQFGKPFYMFETNTASCGGFAGISDTYGAALWAIDYGMQLAYGNFTHGLLHTGGQNSFYNVSSVFFKRLWRYGDNDVFSFL